MPTVKKLQFANGTVISAPIDLTLESSVNKLGSYIDDAAYAAANSVQEGSIYLNSTLKAPRLYLGGVWRTGIMQENATDATKTVKFDTDGAVSGADHILDFNGTADRTYTFPDATGTVVLTLGAQELQDKTIKNGFLDGTKIRNGALDVEAAGALTIGATVGANNLTLGHADSTVQIPGNLTVSGTTTTLNTDTLDVEDKNITVNKGGNDATSAGAGLTVDRTGTKGSLVYDNAAASKFKIGNLGSEVEIADLSSSQALTNKTINASLNTVSNISSSMITGAIAPSKGGTGVANNDLATLTRSGNHPVTLTTTATTSVTLPTSGTLTTVADITAANLTGTVAPSKGGTGVSNNDAATLTRSGNHALTLTTTAATGVTLPTTGILSTLAGSEQLTNKTLVEPVIDNFAAFNHETTPTSAAAGTVRVYAKSDNKLYKIDSTGAEASIGSGAGTGGINYLTDWYDSSKPIGSVSTVAANGNITVSGAQPLTTSAWYADATSGIAAIASSSSTLLRFSNNYLTALSGSSTSGATFVQTAVFNVDGSDLGKPVSISFDLTGVTTADDWDVVVARYTVSGTTGTFAELIPVAGTVSSMTGTPGAQLPTGTTQFRGFFITSSTGTDVYALRFRRRTGTTQIRLDSLTVGPQSLAQGAVVTGWQSYTPSVAGLTTTTPNQLGKYRRVGDSMEILSTITATGASSGVIKISIPSGFTIDTTKLPTNNQTVGTVKALRSGVSIYEGAVEINGTTDLQFYIADSTPQAAGSTTPWAWQANDNISFHCTVPISQWSSGTTTLADRAVEEYAYNTDTTASTNSTSFGYGPDGVLFPNITSFGNTYLKRIRFQTPVLPTDSVIIEYQQSGSGIWRNTAQKFSILGLSTAVYGMQLINAGGNDFDVYFYAQGASSAGSTSFGANGELWSVYYGAGWKWRVRKVSGGAAVGFPVSARNVVGDTSGSVVPVGCVGEKITWATAPVTTNPTTTDADWTNATITVTPGTWLVIANISMGYASSTGGAGIVQFKITDTSNNLIQNMNKQVGVLIGSTTNMTVTSSASCMFVANISSSTTYKIRIQKTDTVGVGTGYVYNQSTAYSEFYAIRIA